MATVTVSPGQSIQAAIDAAASGDTIDVAAGTYNDQFLSIGKSITLQAVGGEVVMTTDTSPPDGKALITEGQPGLSVAINGFDISGVAVADHNGAAIRYEGGALALSNDFFHNNQEGLLGAADPNGSISIDHSEFAANGDGSGSTHNIYVGAIASYSIDLPNGGNTSIANNVIEQGAHTQNPFIVAYGEEGASNPGTSFAITGNTIVNDDPSGRFLLDPAMQPTLSGNSVWGLSATGDTVLLASRPSLDTSAMTFVNPPAAQPPPPTEPPPPPVSPPPPPALTLDQYHAMVAADFQGYAAAHPEVWISPTAVGAIITEITSTTILTHVPGDLWTPQST